MTVVRVYSEPGRIDNAGREALAESLTLAVLEVEGRLTWFFGASSQGETPTAS